MKSVLAIFLGLIGLLMSSCGLFFTVINGFNIPGMLAISLPSLIIGSLLVWAAVRMRKSRQT